MAKDTENNLAERKLKIYDTADDILIESIGKTEKSIMKSIAGLLDKFNIKDGVIVNDETALNLINTLNKEIRKIIKNSTYSDKVGDYLKKFNTLDDLNKRLHLVVNGIKLKKFNLNPIKTQTINDLSKAMLDNTSIDTNIVNPIKSIMFNQVTTGTTLKQAKEVLNKFITGDEKKLGSVRRFVGQIARDSITHYDGRVNDIIRQEYGLNAYRYVGSLIQDSRPQCIRWVGMEVLPFEDLQKEINWAFANGRGMNDATTPETFALYRGGFNCRHMAIPFRQAKPSDTTPPPQIEEIDNPGLDTAEKQKPFLPHNKVLQSQLTFNGTSKNQPKNIKNYNIEMPDQFWDAMPSGIKLVAEDQRGAFYQNSRKVVNVPDNNKRYKSKYNKRRVLAHEYGHALHYKTGSVNSIATSKEFDSFKKSIQKTLRAIKKENPSANVDALLNGLNITGTSFSISKMFDHFKEKYKGIHSESDISEMYGATADFIMGLTKGRSGFGHTKAYMKRAKGAEKEMFAHVMENFWIGNDVFKDLFPEVYALTIEYAETLIKLQ